MAKLKTAVEAGEAAVIASTAHALKGASATIGAKGFAALALVLEHAGKKNELVGTAEAMVRLEADFVDVAGLLRERIARAA